MPDDQELNEAEDEIIRLKARIAELERELAVERKVSASMGQQVKAYSSELTGARELLSRVNDEEGYHLGGRLGSAVEAYCAKTDEAGGE